METPMNNRFIVIDGPDGAGKTTAIKSVVERLRAEGKTVTLTREPGGSPFADKIREVLLSDLAKEADPAAMLHLFVASRIHHLGTVVRPALERGDVVICDRFDSTTYAYQVVAEQRQDLAPIFRIIRNTYHSTLPYYIVLDVSPETGRMRMRDRGKQTHLDLRDDGFHTRARAGFKEFLISFCAGDYAIIDGEKTPEEVAAATLAKVQDVLAR